MLAADPDLASRTLDRPEPVRLMHQAAMLGRLDGVLTLVELGADPWAVTVDDGTPNQLVPPGAYPAALTALDWARYNSQDHVVRYLNGLR